MQLIRYIFIVLLLFSCERKKLRFSDFVEVDRIEKVIISNNSGEFTLSPKQLDKFKKTNFINTL